MARMPTDWLAHGPGGGGAGGVIYLSSAAVSTSVTGGANGTTTAAANAYGATSGTAGVTNTNLTESQSPELRPARPARPLWPASRGIWGDGRRRAGGAVLETAFELGTAGFHVERLEPIGGDYERLNDTLLPALITSPQGGRYTFVDPDAWPGQVIPPTGWWSRKSGKYTSSRSLP